MVKLAAPYPIKTPGINSCGLKLLLVVFNTEESLAICAKDVSGRTIANTASKIKTILIAIGEYRHRLFVTQIEGYNIRLQSGRSVVVTIAQLHRLQVSDAEYAFHGRPSKTRTHKMTVER